MGALVIGGLQFGFSLVRGAGVACRFNAILPKSAVIPFAYFVPLPSHREFANC